MFFEHPNIGIIHRFNQLVFFNSGYNIPEPVNRWAERYHMAGGRGKKRAELNSTH